MTNNITNIAICDVDPNLTNTVKTLCQSILKTGTYKYNFIIFHNSSSLMSSKEDIDIIFLDVVIPDISGLEVAAHLNKRLNRPYIIFLSRHVEMMKKGYIVQAFRFLTKPIDLKEFEEAFRNALMALYQNYHVIRLDKGKKIVIKVSDIIYLEAFGDRSIVFMWDTYYICSYSLKHWIGLLNNNIFVQSHRSFIVNFKYLRSVENSFITLQNGKQVPISARRKKYISKELDNYVKYWADSRE